MLNDKTKPLPPKGKRGPTELEKKNFFTELVKIMYSSAVLTTVMKHSQELAKVPAALTLPCLLSSLCDPKYKEMTEE